MQVVVCSEGREFIEDDIRLPITYLIIKIMLQESHGLPVRHQRLFYIPEHPQQSAGLPLCENEHFVQDVPRLELVLTLGGVSTWAHFYVILPPDQDENRKVYKMVSCRFDSIANIKQRVIDDTGLQVNRFSKQEQNGNLLAENLNLFQCEVENGTTLFCV